MVKFFLGALFIAILGLAVAGPVKDTCEPKPKGCEVEVKSGAPIDAVIEVKMECPVPVNNNCARVFLADHIKSSCVRFGHHRCECETKIKTSADGKKSLKNKCKCTFWDCKGKASNSATSVGPTSMIWFMSLIVIVRNM